MQTNNKKNLLFPFFDFLQVGINYFFHIYVSWYLLKIEYGQLNALLSILAILLVIGYSLQNYTAKNVAKEDWDTSGIRLIFYYSFKIIAVVTILFLISLPYLQHITRSGFIEIIILLIILIFQIVLCVIRGIFQGKKRFLFISFSLYTEVLVKMVILFFFLPKNSSILVTLIAILVGMMISLLVALIQLKILNNDNRSIEVQSGVVRIKFWKSYLFIFIANFFFYFFTSFDMIVVNYVLPQASGIFAVVSKYSQILLFVALSIITMFVPFLSEKSNQMKDFRRTSFLMVVIISAIGIIAIMGYHWIAPYSIPFLFGNNYADAGEYLSFGATAYFIFILSYVLVNINIVLERYYYVLYMVFVSGLLIGLLLYYNNSIFEILFVELVSYSVLLCIMSVDLYIYFKGWDIRMRDDNKKIRLLFLSWRDIKSPNKGGAEVFTHEMLKRLNNAEYSITHISPQYTGLDNEELIDGIKYLRKGNLVTVILYAMFYYLKNKGSIDYVVDQCNTHQFFTPFWVEKNKRIFFIHQLTREIWYHNARFPLSNIGYALEPLLLKLHKNDSTITVSRSTFEDLTDLKFHPNKVTILPEGLDFIPWKKENFHMKQDQLTFIYVGRMVDYKGIDDSINAFINVKSFYPDAKLWIVGKKNEDYLNRKIYPLLKSANLQFGDGDSDSDVIFWGFVSEDKKLELMSKAHALLFPSLREGWGLIVTEAAVVGTPSITYSSPGIRDAVDYGRAGYMCKENNIEQLSKLMIRTIENLNEYKQIREQAYEFSKQFHWDQTTQCFQDFMMNIGKIRMIREKSKESH